MIAIIDYKSGNIKSVANALDKLGVQNCISSNPEIIKSAERIIFPGQGRAGNAMESLKKLGLEKVIKECKKPFLGICIGMQMLLEFSEEDDCDGLGIISGRVRKFEIGGQLKVPLVGWNKVFMSEDALFEGIPEGSYFYFVNSYYANLLPEYVIGRTDYGIDFASVIRKGNFYGTQFHPEKSGDQGLLLLKNFCDLNL